MKIYVKIYATLRQYVPNSGEITRPEGWEVADDATVQEVMASLKLPENLRTLALVNGVHCQDKSKRLSNGDTLLLYPLMSGG